MLSDGSSVWSFGTLKSYHVLILGSCSFIGFQFWRSAQTFPKRAFRYYYIIFYSFRFFAPVSHHFLESSYITSLHSIFYTTTLHTEASTILATARNKRNSLESCNNIWLTFRIIQNVTLNAKLLTTPVETSHARWEAGAPQGRRQQLVMWTRRDASQVWERTTATSADKPCRPPPAAAVTTRPGAARRKPQCSAVFLTTASRSV